MKHNENNTFPAYSVPEIGCIEAGLSAVILEGSATPGQTTEYYDEIWG